MNTYNLLDSQRRDFIINEFLIGEHPISIWRESSVDYKLSHAQAGLVRTEQFLNRLSHEFQSLPQGQELQSIAQAEASLYGKIKRSLHTEQNLRIAEIVGGVMVALALVALLTASIIPGGTGGLICLPSALQCGFFALGLSFGAGGIACLIGTSLTHLAVKIQEWSSRPFILDAMALQNRVNVLQNQG